MTREEIDKSLDELHRFRTQDPVRALALSEELIAQAISIKYKEHLPQLRLYRADLLCRLARESDAEPEYKLCVEIATKAGNKEILGRAICGLGTMQFSNNDLPRAKELFEQSISIAISIEDKIGEGMALASLSEVYRTWGLRELAVGYAKDAYDALKDSDSVTLPLYRLGSLSNYAGDYESARKFFAEGLAFIKKHDIKTSLAPFHCELGTMYSRLGKLEEAREEYNLSLKAAEAIGDTYHAVNAIILQAANEINLKDYDAAEAKLREALAYQKDPRSRDETWVQYYFANIAYHRGDLKEVIRILDKTFSGLDPSLKNQLTEGVLSLYGESYTGLADWQNAALYEKKLREFREETNSAQFKSKLTTAQSLIATERVKHEKELEKMKREQLERELSNTTLQLLAQTEALAEFREGILAVVRKAPPTEPIARELREKLKVLPCKSIDWDLFETQFKAAHPEFKLKLLETYPDLTKMEVRVCTLVRMNLKSEDISRLTCLSERNIENHRYRIRKKMNLSTDQNLPELLNTF